MLEATQSRKLTVEQVALRRLLSSEGGIQFLIFCVAALIAVGHRPSDLFHPQFFAEDGMIWYADAYNIGWLRPLFLTYAGYFETLPRIAASLAILVPLRWAPLVMNGVGIVFQVLPANLLLSRRCVQLGSLPFRGTLAVAYLLLPNTRAVHVMVTNAQWHLALVACLLISAVPANTKWGKAFDIAILILCGLTGPFCLILLPTALLMAWKRRDNWRRVPMALMAASSIIQLGALVVAGRPKAPLGATAEILVKILSAHIYLGALLGPNRLAAIAPVPFLLAVAILGTALILYCFGAAPFEFKLVLLFCILIFAASLKSPIGTKLPAWQALQDSPVMRYWFLPSIAFVWSLLWCVRYAQSRAASVLSGAALLIMCFGALLGYRYPALLDLHFRQYAAAFECSPSGTVLSIPVNPPGWTATLKRK